MKKYIIIAVVLVLLLILTACSKQKDSNANAYDVKIYKSMGCGCCGIYSTYMKNNDNYNVEEISVDDISIIKQQNKIPEQLQSCHTTMIGNYFVEGHIPTEAIMKLMQEKPDILGIAMPGMPSGSPGMPGSKTEPFVIYEVHKDGTYKEFMRI